MQDAKKSGPYVVVGYIWRDNKVRRWARVMSDSTDDAFSNAEALTDLGKKFYSDGCVFVGTADERSAWVLRNSFGSFPLWWSPDYDTSPYMDA